jgi:hypothetical protein
MRAMQLIPIRVLASPVLMIHSPLCMPTISFLFCLSEPDTKSTCYQLAYNFADEDVPINYALQTREA